MKQYYLKIPQCHSTHPINININQSQSYTIVTTHNITFIIHKSEDNKIHQKLRAQLANLAVKHIQIQQFIASYKQHLYIQEIMNAYIPTHVNIQIQHFPTPSQQPINYPTKYFKNSTYIYTFNIKIIKYPTTKTTSQTHTYTYKYTKSLIHTHKNKNPTFAQLPNNYPTHIYTFAYIKKTSITQQPKQTQKHI